MALTPATPRDKLDRLFQHVARARRYWWLTAAMVVVGAGLSVAYAVTRTKVYQSGAVLFYQERIQTSLLQNRDVSALQRNIGEHYRELLLARSSLAEIIRDPELNPFPDVVADEGEDAAVEELRLAVDFAPRGASTFVITYRDSDPDRAQRVTQRLTELLRAKEAGVRLAQAKETADFAESLRQKAVDELRTRQSKLNEFLVAHPEFAVDAAEGQGEGASIRATQRDNRTTRTPAETALGALERQRARIRTRLANPDAPPPTPRQPRPPTPEQAAALQRVAEAERELDAAERALSDARGRYTDLHPTVVKARERVESARARVASAKASVPPDPVAELPAAPVDRGQLQKELADIERQIAAERARQRSGSKPAPTPDTDTPRTNWVVELEDEYQRLKLDVDEKRQQVQTLAESAFRTQMDSQQRMAEQGDSLVPVDPAFKPLRPLGKSKKVVVLGGVVLFTLLGCGLALGLAFLDDRIYRRADLEGVGVAPVLAVIPRAERPARRDRKRRASTSGDAAGEVGPLPRQLPGPQAGEQPGERPNPPR